jgi:hypothetical protein
VFLLVASFAVGYYVHDRQKCPLLTSEELLYVSFLTTGRVTYCDLSPELQREVDHARAEIEAKHRR